MKALPGEFPAIIIGLKDGDPRAHSACVQCPVCGDNYVQTMTPHKVKGNDNYEAGWSGRGDLLIIPFAGECGSGWELCLGFHKGFTYSFIRLVESCQINYREYIQSQEWREKATAAKERAGWRCQVCNRHQSEITLDAHHRTYERLGYEAPGDITVLCRDCHGVFHRGGKRYAR